VQGRACAKPPAAHDAPAGQSAHEPLAFAQLVPPTAVEAKPGVHAHGRQTAAPAPLKKPAGHLPNVGKVAPVLPFIISSLYVEL
jgi:hypothetical protein